MASQDAATVVFQGLQSRISAPRPFNELTILELVRGEYPNHHVACTSSSNFDFEGYASAGHAELIVNDDDLCYDATRHYSQSVSKQGGTDARLYDMVRFGQFTYKWQDKRFVVFDVKWNELYGRQTAVYFILTPVILPTSQRAHPDTDALLYAVGKWSSQLHDEIYVFDGGYWNKSKELWMSVKDCSWDEVILNPTTKANLIADVEGFFDNKALYKALAVPWKRGVILHGVPGNGKTISIKALISALWTRTKPIPSLYVKSFDSCNGRNQKSAISTIFSHARVMAPCLLIFEDLDSLVTDETRSYFLNEVDGLESNDGILMIGSTNHLHMLDPAISKRPSRFDRKYHFTLPVESERRLYCEYWRNKVGAKNEIVPFQEGVCEVVAKWTEGFSFAYLKELFVISLLAIARAKTGANVSVEEDGLEASSSETPHSESSNTASEPVIIKHEDAIAQLGSESVVTKVSTTFTTAEEPTSTPRLPDLIIPEELKEDLLMKTLKTQLSILLKEMQSTPEGDWPSERKKMVGDLSRKRMVRAGYPMHTEIAT